MEFSPARRNDFCRIQKILKIFGAYCLLGAKYGKICGSVPKDGTDAAEIREQ